MSIKESKRTVLSYEEKLEIMNRYIMESKKGITARTEFEGYPIGQWQANMRAKYYKDELKLEEIVEEKFLELGILRKEKERETSERLTWDQKYTIMEEYLKSGKTIDTNTVYNGYRIGQWQTVIRHLLYTDSLNTVSPELKKKFFEMGILKREKGRLFTKGSKKLSYDEKFEIMYKYLVDNEFEKEIHQQTIFEGNPIGVWQDNLRQTYRKGRDLEISLELIGKFFTYGILREEDKNKRRAKIFGEKDESAYEVSEDKGEKEQLIELLLKKQEERRKLDIEIMELQEKIADKNEEEIYGENL